MASRLRRRFFLMNYYMDWGWREEAREQYNEALKILRNHTIDMEHWSFVIPHLSIRQTARLSLVLTGRRAYRQALKLWLIRTGILNLMGKIYHLKRNHLRR